MTGPLASSLSPLGRTRRHATAGPFDPSTIAGLILWLKADSITSGDGGPVATWPDSSTAANNATQSSGTLQPTFHTNQLNGHPVVRFDGSDDVLAITPFTLTYATVFAVHKKAVLGTEACILGGSTNDGISNYTDGALYWIATGAGWIGIAAFADSTSWHVATWRRPATGSYDGWLDGTQVTGIATNASTLDVVQVGKRGIYATISGDVAEVLVYNSGLSDADRLAVETYLTTKYGL